MVKGDDPAVPVGKFLVTLGNRSGSVLLADRLVTLAGERAAHHLEPRGALCDFATVFQLVALADGGFHHCTCIAVFKCDQKKDDFFVRHDLDYLNHQFND